VRTEQVPATMAHRAAHHDPGNDRTRWPPECEAQRPWLRRCVGDPLEFFEQAWQAAPSVHRGSGDDFSDLFSVAELERLLAMDALSRPKVKVVRDGVAVAGEAFSRTAGARRGSRGSIFDCARIARLMRAGGTLVVSSAEQGAHGLFLLCGGLEDELSHRITANVYLSPPAAQGLKPHYDGNDVVILQVAGSKEWNIFGRQADPGGHPSNVLLSPGQEPSLQTVLQPGDTLYLPEGYVHLAKTNGDFSLHVTVVIMKIPVADLLRFALESLAGSDLLSAPLPIGFVLDDELLTPRLAEASQFFAGEISSSERSRELVRAFCRQWHLGSISDQLGPISRAVDPRKSFCS
jgi:bifunctional lysine-specific demethylase and histidyl-hydroxylase NO66